MFWFILGLVSGIFLGTVIKLPFGCKHKWSKWRPIGTGMIYQRKICTKCGLVKDKSV